jgi:heat shock protein HslJ
MSMPFMRCLAIVISLSGFSCTSGGGASDAPPLAGTSWTVTAVGGEALVAGSMATMVFGDDGKVSGSAGCNTFLASYESDGERLTIALIGASKKLCHEPDGVMAQEARFLAALGAAATTRRVDGRLEVATAAGAAALTLTPSVSARP